MKKRTVLLFIILIIISILAFNLPINIKIRTIIKENFQRHAVNPTQSTVILGTKNGIFVDDFSLDVIDAVRSSSHMFMKVSWLKHLGMTTHYDVEREQLNIVGSNQFIIIDQQGDVTWNGIKTGNKIVLNHINSELYIAMDDLKNADEANKLNIQIDDIVTRDVLLFTKGGFTEASDHINKAEGIFAEEASVTETEDTVEALMQWRNLLKGSDYSEETEPSQPVFTQVLSDDVVMVLTSSGNIGYLPPDAVTLISNPKEKTFLEDATRVAGDIHLVWEAVYTRNPNVNAIGSLGTINVISPTWYELADSEGTMSNLSGERYINWAKEKGYILWPLVKNGFDPERTHTFLHDSRARMKFINQLAEEAIAKRYDGINIDFENVYLEDKDALTHFINELSWVIKPLGITLSMDVTVIAESDNWSKCFDREALGKIVDYLVIMTYDEYWQSSPISGPVASYDWVKKGLEEILKIVPSEKIIMGIPLYTRVWTEEMRADTNAFVNQSEAISMVAQNNLIKEKNLSLTWLEEDRLFYTAYVEENMIKKIWIENLETITHKINLSKELSLTGYAFWRRGFETKDFFDTLSGLTD